MALVSGSALNLHPLTGERPHELDPDIEWTLSAVEVFMVIARS